jgi:hypothetical protein
MINSRLFANVAQGGVETLEASGDAFGGGLDDSFGTAATITNSTVTGNLAVGGGPRPRLLTGVRRACFCSNLGGTLVTTIHPRRGPQ